VDEPSESHREHQDVINATSNRVLARVGPSGCMRFNHSRKPINRNSNLDDGGAEHGHRHDA
jgi:hypothetical protein